MPNQLTSMCWQKKRLNTALSNLLKKDFNGESELIDYLFGFVMSKSEDQCSKLFDKFFGYLARKGGFFPSKGAAVEDDDEALKVVTGTFNKYDTKADELWVDSIKQERLKRVLDHIGTKNFTHRMPELYDRLFDYMLEKSGSTPALIDALFRFLAQRIKFYNRNDMVMNAFKRWAIKSVEDEDIASQLYGGSKAREITWKEIPSTMLKREMEEIYLATPERKQIRLKLKMPLGNCLLYGAPGVGKTFLAETLMREMGGPFFFVNSTNLLSQCVGEKLFELIAKANQLAEDEGTHCVIYLDEPDFLIQKRSNRDEASSILTSTFLNQLTDKDNFRLVFICTVRSIDNIDNAFFNRLDRFRLVRYVPIPSSWEERLPIIRALLKQYRDKGFFKGKIETTAKYIATHTNDKYTPDHLNDLLDKAQLCAWKRGTDSCYDAFKYDDVVKAVKEHKPSLLSDRDKCVYELMEESIREGTVGAMHMTIAGELNKLCGVIKDCKISKK